MYQVIWSQLRPILRFSKLDNILTILFSFWFTVTDSETSNQLPKIFEIAFVFWLLFLVVIIMIHMDSELLFNNPSKKPVKLITKGGLRKWIRNPFHFGSILLVIHLSIGLNQFLGWLLAGFLIWMKVEITAARDEYWEEHYPEAFAEWRKHTWRVLPGIV